MTRDTGQPVICRRCNTLTKPANAVDGTTDENRTVVCKECGNE